MKIGIACGGTGGHIYPGLATALELQRRGHEVELWLTGRAVEDVILKDWEGVRHVVGSEGFQYGMSFRSLQTLRRIVNAGKACMKIMSTSRPDVLLAMGSYASAGPVYAAWRLGVPYVLHEANVIPGRAVKLFSRRATRICGCFEETRHYLAQKDLVMTGLPLRPELASVAKRHEPLKRNGKFTVLVLGGSLGARNVNRMVADAARRLALLREDVHWIHVAGEAFHDEMKRFYDQHSLSVELYAYANRMENLYERSHLVICRAGASTCAELIAFRLPSLLIPYPFASNDHQSKNAESMHHRGVADKVAESDLESEWLAEYVDGCANTPERLDRMTRNAAKFQQHSSSKLLADEIERVGWANRV